MNSKSRWISAVYKLILGLCALYGVLAQTGIIGSAPLNLKTLNYYTLLSNLLCALYFLAASAYAVRHGGTLLPVFKGAVVMGIVVTGLVYHFMLSKTFTMTGALASVNIILHYIVPAMSLLDWLLFDEKRHYGAASPFLWVLLPDIYFVYVNIRVALGANLGYGGGRYPYFFIDADALGWGRVLLYVLALNVAFILLGYVLVALDRLLTRKADSKSR